MSNKITNPADRANKRARLELLKEFWEGELDWEYLIKLTSPLMRTKEFHGAERGTCGHHAWMYSNHPEYHCNHRIKLSFNYMVREDYRESVLENARRRLKSGQQSEYQKTIERAPYKEFLEATGRSSVVSGPVPDDAQLSVHHINPHEKEYGPGDGNCHPTEEFWPKCITLTQSEHSKLHWDLRAEFQGSQILSANTLPTDIDWAEWTWQWVLKERKRRGVSNEGETGQRSFWPALNP